MSCRTHPVGVLLVQESDDSLRLACIIWVACFERRLNQLQLLGAKFGQDGGLLRPSRVLALLHLQVDLPKWDARLCVKGVHEDFDQLL